MRRIFSVVVVAVLGCAAKSGTQGATSVHASSQGPLAQAIVGELVQKHGEAARARAERGVKQVLAMWRPEDGDDAAARALAVEHFVSGRDAMKTLLGRYEEAF